MDLSASLTANELQALTLCSTKTLREAGRALKQSIAREGNSNESTFEQSLRIKNTIDALEEAEGHRTTALANIINCEYQLWRINADTPLKYNPFLSHWVEALQRLDKPVSEGKGRKASKDVVSAENVTAMRVLWIKTILQDKTLERWLSLTPTQVCTALATNNLTEPFDIKTYIRMLEEEEIYDKIPLVQPPPEDSLQRQKGAILRKLREDPQTAIFDMTRLPIALPYLDFLTTLLTDRTLEKHSIDSGPVVTQYIQHALRTVEQAEKPPRPEAESNTDGWAEGESVEYGKEAQTRYVQLLLLFIKNLIRKGLIELDVLYYEIAEITVRYVWIKEVRDFRSWAEEGVEGGGAGG